MVERLGIDDEMQRTSSIVTCHLLLDVVGTAVGDDLLVIVGIVEFGIDDVLERGDLWEAG